MIKTSFPQRSVYSMETYRDYATFALQPKDLEESESSAAAVRVLNDIQAARFATGG